MMKNPPHPGETLREDVLPALGLTVTDAAALSQFEAILRDELNVKSVELVELAAHDGPERRGDEFVHVGFVVGDEGGRDADAGGDGAHGDAGETLLEGEGDGSCGDVRAALSCWLPDGS